MAPPRPILSPDEVFVPDAENLRPVPDGLTPDETINAEDGSKIGKALSKFFDALSQPGTVKLLANLGISLAGPGRTSIGEFAIQQAEETARGQFREQLAAGVSPEEASVRGLSTEGREAEVARFEAGQERTRLRELEEQDRARQRTFFQLETQRLRQDLELSAQRGELDAVNLELAKLRLRELQEEILKEDPDPNVIARNTALALQQQLPSNADFSDFTPEQAYQLVLESFSQRQATQRTRIGTAPRTPRGLTPAEKRAQVSALEGQIDALQQLLGGTEDETQRRLMTQRIGDLNLEIAKLGGTPRAIDTGPAAVTNTQIGPVKNAKEARRLLGDPAAIKARFGIDVKAGDTIDFVFEDGTTMKGFTVLGGG